MIAVAVTVALDGKIETTFDIESDVAVESFSMVRSHSDTEYGSPEEQAARDCSIRAVVAVVAAGGASVTKVEDATAFDVAGKLVASGRLSLIPVPAPLSLPVLSLPLQRPVTIIVRPHPSPLPLVI